MMRALIFSALAVMCLGAHCRPIDGCVRGATRLLDPFRHAADAAEDAREFRAHRIEDGRITGHTCVPASEADAAAGGGR